MYVANLSKAREKLASSGAKSIKVNDIELIKLTDDEAEDRRIKAESSEWMPSMEELLSQY